MYSEVKSLCIKLSEISVYNNVPPPIQFRNLHCNTAKRRKLTCPKYKGQTQN